MRGRISIRSAGSAPHQHVLRQLSRITVAYPDERDWGTLQPDDVHQRYGRDPQADACVSLSARTSSRKRNHLRRTLGPDVSREHLSEVTELRPVQAQRVKDLEDEEHGHTSQKRGPVVAPHEICHESRLDDQTGHAAKDAKRHVLWPGEAIDEDHGHGVEAPGEGQPGGWIERLFHRAEP